MDSGDIFQAEIEVEMSWLWTGHLNRKNKG